MSGYPVCPSCGFLLADKQLIFQKKLFELNENINENKNENKVNTEKILNDLNITKYCCKFRMITSENLEKKII